MAPPSKARPRVAYDLGRRGEAMPADFRDDPELAGAYEQGVDDRDAAAAGSNRRKGPPEQRRSPESRSDDLSGEADRFAKSGKGARSRGAQGKFAGAGTAAEPFRRGRGSTGGGLFLGIIGYCIGRAFLTEGPHGIWRWYSAKFMNKTLPRRGRDLLTAPATASTTGRVVST